MLKFQKYQKAEAEALNNTYAVMEGDSEARELELYIENDADLYRQQLMPIIRNIKRKMRRGVYDHDLAPKLWSYLVDNGAKKYAKEFSIASDWNMIFDKRTRIQVAQSLADDYADAITNGEYGPLDESVKITESRHKMDYNDFVEYFKSEILPHVKKRFEKDGTPDIPARREAFNDELDALDREGMLSGDNRNWSGLPDELEKPTKVNESRHKMDYNAFVEYFRDSILPLVKKRYESDGVPDIPARREAFNDEMDALDREGMLDGDTRDWDGLPDELERG